MRLQCVWGQVFPVAKNELFLVKWPDPPDSNLPARSTMSHREAMGGKRFIRRMEIESDSWMFCQPYGNGTIGRSM